MSLKITYNYIIIFFSILFLDMIFPIYLPYVRVLIVLNILVFFLNTNFFPPKKEFNIYFLLIILFFLSACFSTNFYDLLYRDLANVVLITTFLPIFFSQIYNTHIFKKFKKHFFYVVFTLSSIVSIIGLYKFFLLATSGTLIPYLIVEEDGIEKFRLGTSLVGDYNYYAYGLFIGLSVIPILYKIEQRKLIRMIFIVSFLLISFNIFFSSSRRGVILLTIYLLIFSYKFVFKKRKNTIDSLKSKIIIVFIVGLFLSLLLYFQNLYTKFESDYLVKLIDRIESTGDSSSITTERFLRINESFKIMDGYNFFQLLFGDGFDYLKKIGQVTFTPEDYPHNFLLSSLLYGGIFTFIITSIFVSKTYFSYRKNISISLLFLIWYVIGIFMLMTSKNSLFSVQFIILLFIIPYINFNIKKAKI